MVAMVKTLLTLLLFVSSLSASALSCDRESLSRELDDNKHIFVARVTDSSFVPSSEIGTWDSKSWEGEARGYFEALDVIKGNPAAVPYISAPIWKGGPCGGCSGAAVQAGYIYLIFAKVDGPVSLEYCSITKALLGHAGRCAGYRYRVESGLNPEDPGQCEEWLETELIIEAREREEWLRERAERRREQ